MAARAQWIAAGAVLFILGLALGAGLALTTDSGPIAPGSRAPGFDAVDVATGDTVHFAEYHGSVVLLNIWATWCRPCEEEMPSMQRLYEELAPRGLKVVAVSIDKASRDYVLQWVRERGLTFDILQDPAGRIERVYQTTGVPESFVIDSEGVIVKREIGAREWDHPTQVALFRRLLGLEG